MKKWQPPKLSEVIRLADLDPGSLEAAAASINRHIDLFSRADASATGHRIRAGLELLAVRTKVEAKGFGWEAWCVENIHRSLGDIRKLMKIAGATDPDAAAEQERASARKGMAEHRANVSAVDVFNLFLKLNADERAEFMALVEKEMENVSEQ